MKRKKIQEVEIIYCDGCLTGITTLQIVTIQEGGCEFHFCPECRDTRETQTTVSLTMMEAQVKMLTGEMIRHESWAEKYAYVKLRENRGGDPLIRFVESVEGSIEDWVKFWGHFKDHPKFKNGWEVFKCSHPLQARSTVSVGYFIKNPYEICTICNKVLSKSYLKNER